MLLALSAGRASWLKTRSRARSSSGWRNSATPTRPKRRQAVVALGSFGPDLTKAMIQQVGATLKDSDPTVRHAAALSLGNFGPASKAALPDIRAAVKDSSPLVRRAAVFALGNLGAAAKSAVPELTDALSDANETVRHAAAYALGSVGEEAKAAAEALGKVLLGDPDPRRSPGGGFCPGRDRFRRSRGGSRLDQGTRRRR